MKNTRGSILLIVLLLALLFGIIAAFNLFVTTTRSEAVRLEQQTKQLEAQAKARAHMLRGTRDTVRPRSGVVVAARSAYRRSLLVSSVD